MIKQYDFPRIFQNVVGEVIPSSIRYRDFRRVDQPPCLSSTSSQHQQNQQLDQTNRLFIQSRRKKLVRRHKGTKTSACLALTRERSDEDKSSEQNQQPKRNFIKKKQYTLQRSDKQQGRAVMKLSEQNRTIRRDQDDINSSLPNQSSKRNKKSIRLRTSIETMVREEADTSRKQGRVFLQRTSLASAKSDVKMVPTVRSKPKHKTYFNYEHSEAIRPSVGVQEEDARSIDRKRTLKKKKTVNFVVGSQKQSRGLVASRNDIRISKDMKRGTKINQSKTPHSSKRILDETSSQWSARSVVSIKFSNNHIRSKKSLRSEESILLGSNNGFKIKASNNNRRYGTKTFLKFSERSQVSLKKYKSVTSLSQVSIDLHSEWQIPRSKRSIKRVNTNRSLKSTRSIKKTKPVPKGSVLIKSGDPYLLRGDSVRSIELIRNSNFQDMVFKKSAKNLFNTLRCSTDPDIFTQLNNFQKFLRESQIEQQQELQRVMTKPLVIENGVMQRAWVDPRLLREQNLMIDMGLVLMKKMSILRQKKY